MICGLEKDVRALEGEMRRVIVEERGCFGELRCFGLDSGVRLDAQRFSRGFDCFGGRGHVHRRVKPRALEFRRLCVCRARMGSEFGVISNGPLFVFVSRCLVIV